jgi:hypothetical protein
MKQDTEKTDFERGVIAGFTLSARSVEYMIDKIERDGNPPTAIRALTDAAARLRKSLSLARGEARKTRNEILGPTPQRLESSRLHRVPEGLWASGIHRDLGGSQRTRIGERPRKAGHLSRTAGAAH